jgi:hypothetical protein
MEINIEITMIIRKEFVTALCLAIWTVMELKQKFRGRGSNKLVVLIDVNIYWSIIVILNHSAFNFEIKIFQFIINDKQYKKYIILNT